jgi:uncharacterized protein (TIGR00299 family) protein
LTFSKWAAQSAKFATMKTLYLDIFSGISGDMFIGALIDLGVDPRKLGRELSKLKLDEYHLHISQQERQGIAGVKFEVNLEHDHEAHEHHDHGPECDHHHEHEQKPAGHNHEHEHAPGHHHSHEPGHDHDHDDSRNFTEIKQLITESKLSPWVKRKSLAVFQRIADAEGKIHGMPAEAVHFHEVGAVDSIVDIVGACVGLELLGKPRVLAASVTEGVGWIRCAHGRFPIPAPATLAILGARGIGVTQCDEPHELVTPTGAALLAELVEEFGPMEGIVAERIGFGLGTRENKTRPNVLRAILGNATKSAKSNASKRQPALDWEIDRIAVLETNLDDISGEVLGNFIEQALVAGALDVFHTPIQLKKNRPGVLLTVLCAESEADRFSEMLLRETSAFGVRRTLAERRKLRREFKTVKTKFGAVTVKLGRLNGQVVQAAPEFESCRKLATQKRVPLSQIYDAARAAFGGGKAK